MTDQATSNILFVIPGVSDAQAQRAWKAALTARDPLRVRAMLAKSGCCQPQTLALHSADTGWVPGSKIRYHSRWSWAHLTPGMTGRVN